MPADRTKRLQQRPGMRTHSLPFRKQHMAIFCLADRQVRPLPVLPDRAIFLQQLLVSVIEFSLQRDQPFALRAECLIQR